MFNPSVVDMVVDKNTYNDLPFKDLAERILEPSIARLKHVSGQADGDVFLRIHVFRYRPELFKEIPDYEGLEDGA